MNAPVRFNKETVRPALFCLPLRPVLMRVQEEYESQEVEAYAYLDSITNAADGISPRTVGVVPFLETELTARGVHLSPGKMVPWPRRDTCPRRKRCHFRQEGMSASRTREG